MEALVDKISWRRRSARNAFVGSLRADDEGIRLTGRDPESGIDVALSIPPAEVASVHVAAAAGEPPGDVYVVLELGDAEPILLRQVGAEPLRAQLLARKLGSLAQPQLVPQGG